MIIGLKEDIDDKPIEYKRKDITIFYREPTNIKLYWIHRNFDI